jgi:hypothetical protein
MPDWMDPMLAKLTHDYFPDWIKTVHILHPFYIPLVLSLHPHARIESTILA